MRIELIPREDTDKLTNIPFWSKTLDLIIQCQTLFFWLGGIFFFLGLFFIILQYHSEISNFIKGTMLRLRRLFYFQKLKIKLRKWSVKKKVSIIDLECQDLDPAKYSHFTINRCELSTRKVSIDMDKKIPIDRFVEMSTKDDRIPINECCIICLERVKVVPSTNDLEKQQNGTEQTTDMIPSKVVKLPCEHYFHKCCIKDWFSTIRKGMKSSTHSFAIGPTYFCPLCRLDLHRCQQICDSFSISMKNLTVLPK
ncbi:uncharacterized protein NDAI_0D02810 [Naumovozyma dairenensis CBS 421]|uniref:RING-type domain-containing protein n=1 Tax=Naumovozyma dairenensis (strain ATCC 10597 / BCRC 20456 / CBS 421 / NBRC 0211 / NRRL Y-12639) TaxID=1071378 RepID=G0W9Y4_NAUDC|nr:hypothetical protein NDAI_0D02810 [Naumovozyma dairenensis CBS 421]CCD24595.1 hypothetical protein NDAI_0D02810 [Naumovozyma dairenensis CBS 421]